MEIGIALRNSGPASEAKTLVAAARAAEDSGLDHLWVTDHVAIPPDDAEGSGGRYLDPLATLAYLAGTTTRIGLGTSVLILPYRPALPTAKWLATIQELSGGRLRLGAAAGWMEAEFRALGVPRSERGRRCDETLEFLERCFVADECEANGQAFLFLPRPAKPPILIGGMSDAARERAARYGDGWLPIGGDTAKLAAGIEGLRRRCGELGRAEPQIVPMMRLERDGAAERVAELAAIGVTGIIALIRYESADEVAEASAWLTELRS